MGIDEDFFNDFLLEYFDSVIPGFDCCKNNEMNMAQWQQIKPLALDAGGTAKEAIEELTSWAENCYENENIITICGL